MNTDTVLVSIKGQNHRSTFKNALHQLTRYSHSNVLRYQGMSMVAGWKLSVSMSAVTFYSIVFGCLSITLHSIHLTYTNLQIPNLQY